MPWSDAPACSGFPQGHWSCRRTSIVCPCHRFRIKQNYNVESRSQWPRGLRPLAGFESRSGYGCLSLVLYVVLSCAYGGLCNGLITRSEESYRVSNCMCNHRNPERGPMFQLGTYRKMSELMLMLKGDENWSVYLIKHQKCFKTMHSIIRSKLPS
jgi:hypothetical protein